MSNVKDLNEIVSEAGKIVGMADAARGAPDGWMDAAVSVIRHLALVHPYVCADDLWAAGLPPPPEARALGPAFTRAKGKGIVEATGIFVRTKQSTRHRAPVRVWRSALYGVAGAPFDESKLLSRAVEVSS